MHIEIEKNPRVAKADNRTDPSAAEGSKYRLMLATLEPLLRLMENETSNPPAVHLRLCRVHRHAPHMGSKTE